MKGDVDVSFVINVLLKHLTGLVLRYVTEVRKQTDVPSLDRNRWYTKLVPRVEGEGYLEDVEYRGLGGFRRMLEI
jgi:hypothetical protein